MNAQTAGRLAQTVETIAKSQVDALVVLGASFVSATHLKLYVLISLLILMWKRMVSLLLK